MLQFIFYQIYYNELLLFKKTDLDNITKILTKNKNKNIPKKEDAIICSACKNLITLPSDSISIDGHHSHVFTNPAGFSYEIGCFINARGCLNVGDPTLEYTWFPGYSWSISVCSNCFLHLGWFYQSNGNSFYGLILERLEDN